MFRDFINLGKHQAEGHGKFNIVLFCPLKIERTVRVADWHCICTKDVSCYLAIFFCLNSCVSSRAKKVDCYYHTVRSVWVLLEIFYRITDYCREKIIYFLLSRLSIALIYSVIINKGLFACKKQNAELISICLL